MLEQDIKAALVDRLIDKGYLKHGAVIVNEMTVAQKERRADLVVANGRLQAFEIKSDCDSLARLDGQVNTYNDHFDKVIVVCGQKHKDDVLSNTPSHIEVWVVTSENSKISWKVARRGRISPVNNRENLLSFMPKRELIRLLRKAGFCCERAASRAEIARLSEQVPIEFLKLEVLNFIKSRYLDANIKFIKKRGGKPTKPNQLSLLSLYKNNETEDKAAALSYELGSQESVALHPKAIDISRRRPTSNNNNNSPLFVIPRG